ncbi:hypothetical protein D3C73_1147160 [compost metagenome]
MYGEDGDSSETTTPQPRSIAAVVPEPLGKYDPPIDMTFVKVIDQAIKFKEGESIDNNAWMRAYKDRLGNNIKFDWTVTGTDDQYLSTTSNELLYDDGGRALKAATFGGKLMGLPND